MADLAASRARLVQLLSPAVQATGHDLEDVSVSPAGRRKVVRVVVDKDGGVTLDAIAEVARVVSDLLDTPEGDQLLAGAYTLEVSSPGVDRPLTEPRHWRRNVGRLVKAKLADGSTVTGRVRDAADAEVVLDVDGAPRTLLVGEVASAYVQVEFARTAEEDA
jgi:ribosome maturation factor RimP